MSSSITLPGNGSPVETELNPNGTHRQVVTLGDMKAALEMLLELISNPINIDSATGRNRVVVEAINVALPTGANTIGAVNIAAAQTLATVTTVGTVTSLSQVATVPANSFIFDQMHGAWASAIRGRFLVT